MIFCVGEIGSQQTSMNDIERSIRSMQNDMTKLNILIHKNKGKQQYLYQDNVLKESEFVEKLKVCSNNVDTNTVKFS